MALTTSGKERGLLYLIYHNYRMVRTIKADVPPGEFKCRTCNAMWSSFMENNTPCTITVIRNGLHDFDFASPILAQAK